MTRRSIPPNKALCIVITPSAIVLIFLSILYLERQFPVQHVLFQHSSDFKYDVIATGNTSTVLPNTEVVLPKINKTGIQRVFYNRIPKTGSECVLQIFKSIAKLNNFTFQDNRDKYPFEPFAYASREEDIKFVEGFMSAHTPMLYAKHLLFVDFQRYIGNSQFVHYINIVRDPLDRFISYYNYMRFRRDRPHKMSPRRRYMTMDYCVLRNDSECSDVLHTMALVSFFCGSDHVCNTKNSWAVQIAKQNIDKYYIVVGLLDRLREFFMLLEHNLPTYFKGITRYHDILKSRRKTWKNGTKWITKPGANATAILKQTLKYEYELYHYIEQRFNKQVSQLPARLTRLKPLPVRQTKNNILSLVQRQSFIQHPVLPPLQGNKTGAHLHALQKLITGHPKPVTTTPAPTTASKDGI